MALSIFIVVVATVSAVGLHAWLYWRIRNWMNRDLALSYAGDDSAKKTYMLAALQQAGEQKIPRQQLARWLEQRAQEYSGEASQTVEGKRIQ